MFLKISLPLQEANKSWWKKAAEEADLAVSSDSGDDSDAIDERGGDSNKTKARTKAKISAKQAELDRMMLVGGNAARGMSFSGKYPLKTGKLELPKHMIREF